MFTKLQNQMSNSGMSLTHGESTVLDQLHDRVECVYVDHGTEAEYFQYSVIDMHLSK